MDNWSIVDHMKAQMLTICTECIKRDTGAKALNTEMISFEIQESENNIYFGLKAEFPDGYGATASEIKEILKEQVGKYALIAF